MGLFDSDWQRLHKKISRQYELIALRNLEAGLSPEGADVLGIVTEIFREHVPNLSDIEVKDVVRNEHQSFKDFSVRECIARALRQMNPDIPEDGISEIFDAVKSRFHDSEREHEYFLFFIISKMIELQNLSRSRGSYLIEIAKGRIPEPSRLVRFFQMWRQVARYNIAKDRIIRSSEDDKELGGNPNTLNANSLHNIGNELLKSPEPGAVTDYEQAQLLEATTPNISNAWTHVVPVLAKYSKREGKQSFLGQDKSEKACRELEEQLYLVVLALYGDSLLSQGASTKECLSALLRSLVSFKEVYPNWTDAYSAAYRVFVLGRENITQILARHQHAVETKLF